LLEIPYLLDCKPRLLKLFFIILCGLQSRAAYIVFFFILSKSSRYVQFFLGYVLLTKLFFHILFSSAPRAQPSQKGLRWTEGSCCGASIITRVTNDA